MSSFIARSSTPASTMPPPPRSRETGTGGSPRVANASWDPFGRCRARARRSRQRTRCSAGARRGRAPSATGSDIAEIARAKPGWPSRPRHRAPSEAPAAPARRGSTRSIASVAYLISTSGSLSSASIDSHTNARTLALRPLREHRRLPVAGRSDDRDHGYLGRGGQPVDRRGVRGTMAGRRAGRWSFDSKRAWAGVCHVAPADLRDCQRILPPPGGATLRLRTGQQQSVRTRSPNVHAAVHGASSMS